MCQPVGEIEKKLRGILARTTNIELQRIIKKIIPKYKSERKLFVKRVKNVLKTQDPKVIDGKELEKVFDLDDGRIIIGADKNMGFTVMNISDYIEQYSKINKQQHFGVADISEDWYVKNMLRYIKDAEKNLPAELKKIILPSNFKVNVKEPCIGVLRLCPKIHKLKKVSHEKINELKSRGIKSSMKDPIKNVQVILDRIFDHILFYMEKHFHQRYRRMSPCVTGVLEAVERIKLSETGNYGESIEFEADFSDLYRQG